MKKKLLLGLTGSIATPKAAQLAHLICELNTDVQIVLTQSAERFLSPETLKSLSKFPIHRHLFNPSDDPACLHITLAKWANIILIAPASAHCIAQLAGGLCSDLLTTLCLASASPILLAPAMHDKMWKHPATQNNVQILKQRGVTFIGPAFGQLACGGKAIGRMMEPALIAQHLAQILNQQSSYRSLNILVTAGATCEPIDSVRYITNRSSGKMGYAIAEAAVALGAKVTLISGLASVTPPSNCQHFIQVATTKAMHQSVIEVLPSQHIFISVAAVSDYYVANAQPHKIKRNDHPTLNLQLQSNPDILQQAKQYPHIFAVGFAAESTSILEHAREKLQTKKVDLIVANDVSRSDIGFDSNENEVYILSKHQTIKLAKADKRLIARTVLDHIVRAYFGQTKRSLKNKNIVYG